MVLIRRVAPALEEKRHTFVGVFSGKDCYELWTSTEFFVTRIVFLSLLHRCFEKLLLSAYSESP